MILSLAVMAAVDDFGTTFPSWTQLSAVALLVGGMAVIVRVLFKRLDDALKREIARADAAEAANDKLYREFIDRLLPTLTDSQRVNLDMAAEVRSARDEIRNLRERR